MINTLFHAMIDGIIIQLFWFSMNFWFFFLIFFILLFFFINIAVGFCLFVIHRRSQRDILLRIHCKYVSVTKPTCPAFSAWLNTRSIRSLKVTGKAIMLYSMALPSKLCAALHGQSNVGSMCDWKPCRSLDLSVLVKILSGVDSNHGTGSRRKGSVNSRSTLCAIERRSCWPNTLL